MMTTTVIALSEYAPDAVLYTVRLYAWLVLETITLGYRSTKIDTTQAAMVTVLAVKCVQMMKPVTATAVNGATRRAASQDRSRMPSVVFRHRNVAPCCRQISTNVTPVNTA